MIPDLLKPKRGRPRKPRPGETHPERIKHIRAAFLVLVAGYRPAQAARAYRVTRETIHRWIRLVKGYDDPEARALREMCGIEHPESRRRKPGGGRPIEPEGGRRPRGRPRAAESEDVRERVEAMERGEFSVEELAARYGVSRSTVYRWRKAVLERYDDPALQIADAPVSGR